MGDQRVGVPAESAVHADSGDGGRRAALVMDWLRLAMGRCRADQPVCALVPAVCRVLAGLSVAPSREAVYCASFAERCCFLDDSHALAGAQLWSTRPARV